MLPEFAPRLAALFSNKTVTDVFACAKFDTRTLQIGRPECSNDSTYFTGGGNSPFPLRSCNAELVEAQSSSCPRIGVVLVYRKEHPQSGPGQWNADPLAA
eukprot:3941432-Rhodomonas_salina.12